MDWWYRRRILSSGSQKCTKWNGPLMHFMHERVRILISRPPSACGLQGRTQRRLTIHRELIGKDGLPNNIPWINDEEARSRGVRTFHHARRGSPCDQHAHALAHGMRLFSHKMRMDQWFNDLLRVTNAELFILGGQIAARNLVHESLFNFLVPDVSHVEEHSGREICTSSGVSIHL